ncbi:MAG: hypothetical protein HY698_00065 [Deltaproteobacteria bacterium]|nr:hypothetical protein [Deltaproteobacteria bacterium]
MSMSTSEERQARPFSQPSARNGAAGAAGDADETSGLHDIRRLARTTLERHAERLGGNMGDLAESLMISGSPLTLGQVLLPTPSEDEIASDTRREGTRRTVPLGRTVLVAIGSFLFGVAVTLAVSEGRATSSQSASVPETRAYAPVEKEERNANEIGTASPAPPLAEQVKGDVSAPAEARATAAKPKEERDSKETRPLATPGVSSESAAATPASLASPASKKPEAMPNGSDKPQGQPASLDSLLDDAIGGAPAKEAATVKSEADSKLPSTLSREEVRKGMGSIQGKARACHDKYQVPGLVMLKVKIEPDGSVSSAVAVDAKFKGTETGACVADAVKTARFSRWNGAPMTIDYPIKLEQ